MKFVSLQPLTGGMYLGAKRAFDGDAACIVSFPGFDQTNERVLLDYLKKKNCLPPYYTFSKNALEYLGVSDGSETYVPNSITTDPYEPEEVTSKFVDVDVAFGVPFCSGLSGAAGIKKDSESNHKAGSDAVQNYNQMHLIDYALKTVKPKVYVYENAPGLCSNLGEKLRGVIADRAKSYGYSVTFVKTNTILHGIPQSRPRTFVVFWKWPDDKEIPPPKMSWWSVPKPTVSEYLDGIAEEASQNDPVADSVISTWDVPTLSEDPIYKFVTHKFGLDWRSKIGRDSTSGYVVTKAFDEFVEWSKTNAVPEKYFKVVSSWREKYLAKGSWWDGGFVCRGDEAVPVLFFRSVCRLIHPFDDRTFTRREVMHLMGLPDDLDWPTDLYDSFPSLVGQNVPVDTAASIFADVKRVVDDWDVVRTDFDGGSNVVFHDNVAHAKKTLTLSRGGFKW